MNTRSNSAKIGYFTIQAFMINKAFLKTQPYKCSVPNMLSTIRKGSFKFFDSHLIRMAVFFFSFWFSALWKLFVSNET